MARAIASSLWLIVNFAVWLTLWRHNLAASLIAAIAITALLSFLATLFHELGHVVAALLMRRRINAIAVKPFELRFRPMRMTIFATKAHRDIGGYVELANDDFGSMRKDAILAAAGPGANFVLATIAAAVAFGLHSHDWITAIPRTDGLLPSDAETIRILAESKRQEAAFIIAAMANALAVLSAGMGLFNLLPFAGSDGDSIACWLRFRWPRGRA